MLSKITSSFQVLVGTERVNLGLNLKFEGKKLKVLGYSRKTEGGWEFSNKAVGLIQEYMAKFPAFFDGIMRNPHGDTYRDTDFFDASESKQRVDEIKEWLKGIGSKGFEQVSLDAEQLDGDAVMSIERAIDGHYLKPGKPRRINRAPRKALLKPLDAEHRLADQRFALGDRVVYVQDSGKVPIASRGTVIGLTRSARALLVDVLWDITFMSGTTLGNRCSPFRGMTVPVTAVLNLTDRQLNIGTKASQPNTTFVQAPMPAPLTSSYANAAMGSGSSTPSPQPGHYPPPASAYRGGRGGGGVGRGVFEPFGNSHYHPGRGAEFVPRGSSVVLSRRGGHPGPAAAVQQQQHPPPTERGQAPIRPGAYQNVPPPAVLSRGRGGGRVGFARRGGRGLVRGSNVAGGAQQVQGQ